MNIQQIREKYPQYENIDDEKLLNAFHAKYYSKMPKEEFYSNVGYNPQAQVLSEQKSIAQQQANLTPQEQFVSSLMSGVAGANKSFGDTYHGIMQPLIESKYAPEWLRKASKETAGERNRIYEEEKGLNPLSAMGGYGLGEVGKALPGVVAGGSGLIPYAGAGHFARALGGGIGGAASGGAQYVNPEESRALNALMGGSAGLLFGGLGPSAVQASYKGGKNILNAFPAGQLAKRVNATGYANANQYNKLYPEFFEDLSKAGGKRVRAPDLDYEKIMKENPGDIRKLMTKFLENPTPKMANRIRSELGNEVRDLTKKKVSSGLSTLEKENLYDLRQARRHISKSMRNTFEKTSPEFSSRYNSLNTGYRRDVVPYTRSQAIGKYRANEMGNPAFVKALANEEKFMHQVGRRAHPELATRQLAPTLAKYLGIPSLGLGALKHFSNNNSSGDYNE